MEYFKFILYGLIQGLTEFIPVSSTAHLKIISLFFGIDDPGPSLSAIIQIGSVMALFCYFRTDIFNLRNKCSKKFSEYFLNQSLIRSIFVGTIPIIFFGGTIKLFFPYFFDNILRSNLSIALVSLFMAIFMYLAERSRKGAISLNNHNYSDSLLIGLSQAFAVIPGFSRSGITISTALLSGWNRADAAKFSFLLGIPAISLSAIVEFIYAFKELSAFSFFPLFFGFVSTFFSSLIAINFFINYFASNGLKLFIIYRLLFSILILLNL